MRKAFRVAPAVIVLFAGFQASTAVAQSTTYTITIDYPTNASTLIQGSNVQASGTIQVNPATGTAPNQIKVVITDKGGNKYTATCGATQVPNAPGRYSWSASVSLPSNAVSGQATCLVQGSTNGGTTYNAGAQQTTPYIASGP